MKPRLIYFVGMGMMLTAASTNTVLQTIVPDELCGRVASLDIVFFLEISPLGRCSGAGSPNISGRRIR